VASANGDKPAAPPPPWEGAPATAALFADFLSYRSPRVDRQLRDGSEHEAAAAAVAYSAAETGGPVAAQAIHSPPSQPHPCPRPTRSIAPTSTPMQHHCHPSTVYIYIYIHTYIYPSTSAGHLLERGLRGQARPVARPPSRPVLAGATPAAAPGGRRNTCRAGPGGGSKIRLVRSSLERNSISSPGTSSPFRLPIWGSDECVIALEAS